MVTMKSVLREASSSPSTPSSPSPSSSEIVPVTAAPSLAHCQNISRLLEEYFMRQVAINASSSSGRDSEEDGKSDQDALIYIVVVLAFYSFGIVFMMIKYMRKEQRELEETKLYQQYMKAARERWTQSTSRGRLCNRLALQALNTVNAIPQTTQNTAKVTFV